MSTGYQRSEDYQRLLAQEADRILAEHAQRKARQRGVVNEHHVEPPEPPPTAHQMQVDEMASMLVSRLAEKDRGLQP